MFLLQPWDKPMNYSDDTMHDAKTKESYFHNFLGQAKAVVRQAHVNDPQGWTTADRALHEHIVQTQHRVHTALCDNFKTYEAMQALVDMVSECNKYMKPGSSSSSDDADQRPKHYLIRKAALYLTKILRLFGVATGSDEIGLGDAGTSEAAVAPVVDAFCQFRDTLRTIAQQTKQMAVLEQCDIVRDDVLAGLGVKVEDGTDKSVWKLEDPATIRAQVAERKAQQAAAAAKKRAGKMARLEQDLAKARAAAVLPHEYFAQQSHKYGSFDATTGLPLTTADGAALSKSQSKAVNKELASHTKAHNKLMGQMEAEGSDVASHLAKLQAALDALKEQDDK